MRSVLVCGGLGFLGRFVAKYFKLHGEKVYGVGHGARAIAIENGYDDWVEADIFTDSLSKAGFICDVTGRLKPSQSEVFV